MGYYDFLSYIIEHFGLLLFLLFFGFLIFVAVVTWKNSDEMLGLPPKKKKRKRSNDCQYF